MGMRTEIHSCFCVGPQDGDPVCPCMMKNLIIRNGRYIKEIDMGPVKQTDLEKIMEKPKKQSYFITLPKEDRCTDPSHNPPTHMVIPQGQIYVHVCPSCQRESSIMSPQISC